MGLSEAPWPLAPGPPVKYRCLALGCAVCIGAASVLAKRPARSVTREAAIGRWCYEGYGVCSSSSSSSSGIGTRADVLVETVCVPGGGG